MKITYKHYFLIFLFLLLIVVLIRNYTNLVKTKQVQPTQKVIVRNQESRGETIESNEHLTNSWEQKMESIEMLPFFEKRKDTDIKASERTNPFDPIIQQSAKIDPSTKKLDNREEVATNKRHPQLIRLVGVIADEAAPLAIVEVGNISYIVSIGAILAEMEVSEIRGDEIVLIAENEKWIIKLE